MSEPQTPKVPLLIADLRQVGLSQLEIANAVGCAQSSIHEWETSNRGAKRGISGNYLLKLMELHRLKVSSKRRPARAKAA